MEQKEQFTTKKKKEIFIEAYKINNDVSKSCKSARIGRTTYYRWIKQTSFREKLDTAVEELRDKIESTLIDNALSGNPKHNACLIFYMKTKMRDRGYIEKQEIEHIGDIPMTINLITKSNDEIKKAKGIIPKKE